MPYTVYLKKNEEKRLLAGHSWVFANEVARIEGKDKNGALATVCAFDGRYIGKGYINHASKILVRIFIRNNQTDEGDFYYQRILEAWMQRQRLGYQNCCRVVFGEADNLPALIVDKYADYETFSDSIGNPFVKEGMVARVSCKVVDTMDVGRYVLFLCDSVDGEILGEGRMMTADEYLGKDKTATPPTATVYRTLEEVGGWVCPWCCTCAERMKRR